MNNISTVVKKYKKQQGLNLRQFAEAISDASGDSYTRQAIHQWEHGITRPDKFALVKIVMKATDWRLDFATECLEIMDKNWRN